MSNFVQPEKNTECLAQMPPELPILPLRNTVAFPYSVLPLVVGIPRSIKLIEDALEGDRLIGLAAMKDSTIEEPQPGQIYEVGTVAVINRVVNVSDDKMHVVIQGLERFRIDAWSQNEPYLKAKISLAPDAAEGGMEEDALVRSLREMAKEIVSVSPNIPDEIGRFLDQVDDPNYLVYLIAANANMKISEGQDLLEIDDLKGKLRSLIAHLTREKEFLNLGRKIQSEAKEEMNKAQREYFLRQQMKAIKKELGDAEENESVSDEYMEKIEAAGLPEEAEREALRELKRLEEMPSHAAEYQVIKTYLDWLVELPWNTLSEDRLDIDHARTILDEDHYDLAEVKERIIEYLAVRKLIRERAGKDEKEGCEDRPFDPRKNGIMGAILCFAGPPGVGKTSLGQSIARALGRKFTRMSLGGMRDEAEIRGHRRTYIGSMPGRIIQAIKRAGTRNPVFMLDEVDKIGSDWRGDPSSALLEVLDPAQNNAFRDYYLDVDFDLSEVIFITTANQLETIPAPLRDRIEIIQIEGYTEYEKTTIARDHLVPRQLRANALREDEIVFTEEALRKIVRDYTREAGVRNLERQIGSICRKSAVRITRGQEGLVEITPEVVRDYLKKEKFENELSESIEIPGIATGLAVTATGGDILFIEATRMKGKGTLNLTGQLGDVMRESVQIAHSYVRSKADVLGVPPDLFRTSDLHVHVPAGAIPKDGPSAGVAMVLAITSLFTGRPVRSDLGMTGEVTLRGRVLPVGGIKMKVLAAHRAGLTTVILPKRNEADLEDLPREVLNDITFALVDRIEEALDVALMSEIVAGDIPPKEGHEAITQLGWEEMPPSVHRSPN